ncbi:unnamed protein product [Trifolium pratense]|uniref:Uncharacterized protein n=1 Tax=Trifolium pratense TaxID=57577 RepID=A0ACB0KMY8_TRIPR|nr:unnamed protein product [Trifolium pratense]
MQMALLKNKLVVYSRIFGIHSRIYQICYWALNILSPFRIVGLKHLIPNYFKVIAGLWVLFIVGSWTNFLTLFYIEDQKATETQIDTPVKKFGTESDSKLRRSYIECQHTMIWFSSSLCTFDILVRLSCSNNYKHYLKTGKYTVHNGTFINRAMFTKSFV